MCSLVLSAMAEVSGTLGKLLNVFIFYTVCIHLLSNTLLCLSISVGLTGIWALVDVS